MKKWSTETPAGIAIVGFTLSCIIGLPGTIGGVAWLFGDVRGIAGIVLSLILLIGFVHVTTDI